MGEEVSSDFFLENELDVVIGDALTLHFTVFFSDDSKLHKIESRVDTTLPPNMVNLLWNKVQAKMI